MMMRRLISFFLLLVLCSLTVHAQFITPVEKNKFATLTSYDELQEFLAEVSHTPGISLQHIAQTIQNRNISLVTVTSSPPFGSDRSRLRVLFFAQQHGDEPSGKEAMTLLVAKATNGNLSGLLKHIDLMIVPQMNPDGSELRQRRTADSIDLNRNHLLLTSPATKALHDVFYQWMPHVTMDIHEYGSFSSEWSDSGFIKAGDVQLGMLTNLNTSSTVYDQQHNKIFPFLAGKMKSNGYSFHEYIVGTPGTYVRHSTTEINDGRQSFGILGTVSFIQEGRKWKTIEDQLERRALSQLVSAEALLDYCSEHAQEIREIVAEERGRLAHLVGQPVALMMDHYPSSKQMSIPVHMVRKGIDSTWRVQPYLNEVKLLKSAVVPKGFVVRKEDSSIVALLLRHHIKVDIVKKKTAVEGTSYVIDSVDQTVLEEDTLPTLTVSKLAGVVTVTPGDYMISTAQIQSRLITIALEPESIWGLTKYDRFDYLRKKRSYPILRVP